MQFCGICIRYRRRHQQQETWLKHGLVWYDRCAHFIDTPLGTSQFGDKLLSSCHHHDTSNDQPCNVSKLPPDATIKGYTSNGRWRSYTGKLTTTSALRFFAWALHPAHIGPHWPGLSTAFVHFGAGRRMQHFLPISSKPMAAVLRKVLLPAVSCTTPFLLVPSRLLTAPFWPLLSPTSLGPPPTSGGWTVVCLTQRRHNMSLCSALSEKPKSERLVLHSSAVASWALKLERTVWKKLYLLLLFRVDDARRLIRWNFRSLTFMFSLLFSAQESMNQCFPSRCRQRRCRDWRRSLGRRRRMTSISRRWNWPWTWRNSFTRLGCEQRHDAPVRYRSFDCNLASLSWGRPVYYFIFVNSFSLFPQDAAKSQSTPALKPEASVSSLSSSRVFQENKEHSSFELQQIQEDELLARRQVFVRVTFCSMYAIAFSFAKSACERISFCHVWQRI